MWAHFKLPDYGTFAKTSHQNRHFTKTFQKYETLSWHYDSFTGIFITIIIKIVDTFVTQANFLYEIVSKSQ